MITEFDDFCTWVFVVVDDIWKPIAPLFKRPNCIFQNCCSPSPPATSPTRLAQSPG